MRKAIATPDGMTYVDLTPAEEAQRQAEANAHANRPPPIPRFEGVATAIENAPDWTAAKGLIVQWMRGQ